MLARKTAESGYYYYWQGYKFRYKCQILLLILLNTSNVSYASLEWVQSARTWCLPGQLQF